jgi:DNA-nicking Smr family endonuclease
MKRRLDSEEAKLWAKVTATVRPALGRKPLKAPIADQDPLRITVAPPPLVMPAVKPQAVKFPPGSPRSSRPSPEAPEPIEPRRKRRIIREQELGPSLDLHGLDQDRARQTLIGFVRRAHEDGWRAVLIITGKGSRGDGVLRRMTPEWLSDPAIRGLVSGVSEAHRTHGGGGALYVALKRRRG